MSRSVGVRRAALGIASAVMALALLGCAANKPKPTPLEIFQPKASARQVWSASIGSIGSSMVPTLRGGTYFVAASDGTVAAFDAETGSERWRTRISGEVSAGVGSDGRFTSVVTRGNEVVTLDAGREIWRKRLTSRVVTPPLVAGERVFVIGVDRAVQAFDAVDGRRLWTLQRPGDALTLAQASVINAFGNNLLVGQGSRLTAVDPLRGTVVWDISMASPRGTNEVERLADLIGPAVRVGDRLCARAFQSAVACADVAKGSLLWSRNVGGYNAVGSDADLVFGADATDRVTAWRAATGDVAWTTEKYLYRRLSGAIALGSNVVFGDFEGYLHFLASSNGEPVLRLPTDGSAVVGTPVASGGTLLVATKRGGLFAFRAQ